MHANTVILGWKYGFIVVAQVCKHMYTLQVTGVGTYNCNQLQLFSMN